jgi:lipoyl(octanoyl) transferase
MARGAYLLDLGIVPYREAWELQRSLAGAVSQGAIPETVVFLEHPPVVTLGRRTDTGELHVPPDAEVDVVETDRGGKSTFHGPGQLVCYPILDLRLHGKDVKKYVRELEEALIRTLAPFGLEGIRFEGLTGVWLHRPPRKIASIGVHISRWITTHGYALNVISTRLPSRSGSRRAASRTRRSRPLHARSVGPSRSTRSGRLRTLRSPTCSSSSSRRSRRTTAPACGRSRCTNGSRRARR